MGSGTRVAAPASRLVAAVRPATIVAVCVMAAALLAAACNGRDTPGGPSPLPSEPLPTTPLPSTIVGVWHGYLKGTECVGALPCSAERTMPFVLRVVEDGAGYRATFELPVESAGQMKVIMDVVGRTEADGVAVFSGSRGPIDSDGYHVELRRLSIRIDPASGLTGAIDLQKWPTANLSARSLRGPITSASYQPLSPAAGPPLDGTWRGRAVIRACDGYCPIYQDEGDDVPVVVVVGQAGQIVIGHVQPLVNGCATCWIPVSGIASGQTMWLSSEPHVPPASVGRRFQIESFEATADALGRLAGRFVIAVNNQIAVAPFDVFSRLDCEFTWLQRD